MRGKRWGWALAPVLCLGPLPWVGPLLRVGPSEAAGQERASAPEDGPRNRFYGEILGPGLIYSLDYERQVTPRVSLRLGAGGWPAPGFQYVLGFGMGLVRWGTPRHRLYAGLGLGMAWFTDVDLLEQSDVVGGIGSGLLAYQYQPDPEGGFFLRASYTPLASSEAIAPLWGGLSLGWAW